MKFTGNVYHNIRKLSAEDIRGKERKKEHAQFEKDLKVPPEIETEDKEELDHLDTNAIFMGTCTMLVLTTN